MPVSSHIRRDARTDENTYRSNTKLDCKQAGDCGGEPTLYPDVRSRIPYKKKECADLRERSGRVRGRGVSTWSQFVCVAGEAPVAKAKCYNRLGQAEEAERTNRGSDRMKEVGLRKL